MSVPQRHGKELLKRNLGAVRCSQKEVIIAVFVAHLWVCSSEQIWRLYCLRSSHTHTRQSGPCPSTFDPQSPVCLTDLHRAEAVKQMISAKKDLSSSLQEIGITFWRTALQQQWLELILNLAAHLHLVQFLTWFSWMFLCWNDGEKVFDVEMIFLTTKILTPDCLFLFLHHDCDSWSVLGDIWMHLQEYTGKHSHCLGLETVLVFSPCLDNVTDFFLYLLNCRENNRPMWE